MSLLRARVTTRGGWWVAKLLDLDVVASGASEAEMLRELEHAITAEYHLALKGGKTPFVNIFREPPPDIRESWQNDTKKLRQLSLPEEVRVALAAVFREPCLAQFNIRVDSDSAAA